MATTMNRFPFKQVDVFSTSPFSGNPVAVIMMGNEVISTDQMQQVARWTNLSETTFVFSPSNPAADYSLRIFTTSRELLFAGHPTLGSCHAWLESGGKPKQPECIVQECGAGLINLRKKGDVISFEAPPRSRSGPLDDLELETIVKGLGIDRSDVLHHAWCDNGPPWRGIMLKSQKRVLELIPDAAILGDKDVGVIGVKDKEKEELSSDYDYEVRAFCPLDSPFEDPVTGSLNAAMAQWLIGDGIAPQTGYVVRQGTSVNRSGRVNINTEYNADATNVVIWVGGRCLSCLDGFVNM